MKKVYIAYSKKPIKDAVEELYNKLNEESAVDNSSIKLIVFFASSNYDTAEVNDFMNARFGHIKMIGCTTAGEISSGYMGSDSIVAMGLTSDIIQDLHIEVIENLDKSMPDCVPSAQKFNDYFGLNLFNMSSKEYFGLVLIDGLSMMEETFLDAFGEFTNILFTGGSSGDDLKFKETAIFTNGKYYKHSGLICIIKAASQFGIERTQSFRKIGKTLKVTKACTKNRIIYELNGKPAADTYCEALGIKKEELRNRLIVNPLGLMLSTFELPFVRSAARILDDGSFGMHCSVMEGTELEILESVNMIAETNKCIETIKNKYKNINGIIAFNCVLRYLEVQITNEVEEFGDVFKDIPTIGFCTYGEYYIGLVNQTLTMLVF